MAIERERKFKATLDQTRALTHSAPSTQIEQLYLSPLESENELRIRRIGTSSLVATLKQGHGERREETEVDITPLAWRTLSPHAVGRILKTRHYLNPAGTLTLDTYPSLGPARNYGLLEIEEGPEDDITNFDPRELGAGNMTELTGHMSASNRHLATPLESTATKTRTDTADDLLRAVHALYDPAETLPRLITLSGPSASGKSTLLGTLKERYGDDLTILTTDNYYIGKTRMQREMPAGEENNFDHPSAIDTERLAADLARLHFGTTNTPLYDMLTSEPRTETEQHRPTPLIILEGLIANHPRIRGKSMLSAALTAPLHERLVRRIERDRTRKAHTPETTMDTFLNLVEPSYHTHYAGFDRTADLHIET